ncbi:hypothetical protein MBANPS3_012716, partial [Mucor bainieri]
MAMLGPIDENAAKLFNFEGFYKVLCAVVGGKHLDKHKAENPCLLGCHKLIMPSLSVDPGSESADLPAKDIRALVAVACNLCQSAEHPTVITKHHVKEKLYHDKQESIPPAALEVAAS